MEILMRFEFECSSDSPYPVKTEGSIEANQWHIAARIAVQRHRDDLRQRGKLRRMGPQIRLRVWKV
jgi:hypothetical protein